MKLRRATLLFITLVTSVMWVVILAPAQTLAGLITGPLLAQGYHGTLWSGRIEYMTVAHRDNVLPIGEVRWRLQAASLFRLRPCIDFSTHSDSPLAVQSVQGLVCISRSASGQSLEFSNVSIVMPAAIMLRDADLALGGQVRGTLHNLHWSQGALVALDMQGVWTEPTLSGDLGVLRLSALPFALREDGAQRLHMTINNHEQGDVPPLWINLESLIALDGRFSARVLLRLTELSPSWLQQWLPVIAEQRTASEYYAEWGNQST